MEITLRLDPDDRDVLARLIAEQLAERLPALATAAAQRQPPMHAASPYMTVKEAADYLRCSRQRIYDLRSSGQLSRHGDGRRVLVSRAELDALACGEPVAHALPTGPQSRSTSGVAR
jgi:excisionase family DNA binding protein